MTKEYKTFITFLDKHIQSENELDMVIYNIGTVQRIAEQFAQFYNQQIKETLRLYSLRIAEKAKDLYKRNGIL